MKYLCMRKGHYRDVHAINTPLTPACQEALAVLAEPDNRLQSACVQRVQVANRRADRDAQVDGGNTHKLKRHGPVRIFGGFIATGLRQGKVGQCRISSRLQTICISTHPIGADVQGHPMLGTLPRSLICIWSLNTTLSCMCIMYSGTRRGYDTTFDVRAAMKTMHQFWLKRRCYAWFIRTFRSCFACDLI